MKIKAIASICSKSKRIFIFDKNEDGFVEMQWIGDGNAMYPVFDLPYLEDESLFAIFDIPEKNRKKYILRHNPLPNEIDFADAVPCENRLDKEKLNIGADDHVLIPLKTQRGLVFIDEVYLKPLRDMEETLELYERITNKGKVYIVAKSGLMVVAVISPYEIVSSEFLKQMRELTKNCEFALAVNMIAKMYVKDDPKEEAEEEPDEDPEQVSFENDDDDQDENEQ